MEAQVSHEADIQIDISAVLEVADFEGLDVSDAEYKRLLIDLRRLQQVEKAEIIENVLFLDVDLGTLTGDAFRAQMTQMYIRVIRRVNTLRYSAKVVQLH